jgi:hypothetical protein
VRRAVGGDDARAFFERGEDALDGALLQRVGDVRGQLRERDRARREDEGRTRGTVRRIVRRRVVDAELDLAEATPFGDDHDWHLPRLAVDLELEHALGQIAVDAGGRRTMVIRRFVFLEPSLHLREHRLDRSEARSAAVQRIVDGGPISQALGERFERAALGRDDRRQVDIREPTPEGAGRSVVRHGAKHTPPGPPAF